MTVLACVVMSALTVTFERDAWVMPSNNSWFAIVYNAVLVFGFAHAAWFFLARTLPPVASTLSVMFIPILGVFAGRVLAGRGLALARLGGGGADGGGDWLGS